MDIQVFHLSNGKLSNITFFSPQFCVQCRRKEQLELGLMLRPLMILQEVRKIRERRAKRVHYRRKKRLLGRMDTIVIVGILMPALP